MRGQSEPEQVQAPQVEPQPELAPEAVEPAPPKKKKKLTLAEYARQRVAKRTAAKEAAAEDQERAQLRLMRTASLRKTTSTTLTSLAGRRF
jgi:hypothetical protein